jgi:hypothetical protein
MNATKLAGILDGMEYPLNLSRDLLDQAKAAGLVIVYGASDDLMELEGAIRDEFGCYEGGVALVDAQGLLPNWENVREDDESEIEAYILRKKSSRTIEAIWGEEGFSWTYKTDIPHVTFEVMEDDETYCRGIIFSLSDLAVGAPSDKSVAIEVLARAVEGFLSAREKYQAAVDRASADDGQPWWEDSCTAAVAAYEVREAASDDVAAAYRKYREAAAG